MRERSIELAIIAPDGVSPTSIEGPEPDLLRTAGPGLPELPISRLHLGSELCEQRLPTVSELAPGVAAARERGLAVTLVTPPVTDVGLNRVRRLLDHLSTLGDETIEIVANDWGVLYEVAGRRPTFEPVLGRLMTPTLRDPRLGHRLVAAMGLPEAVREAFRATRVGNPHFADMLTTFGVSRIELDNLVQGGPPDLSGTRFRGSLHLPWGVVATGRLCRMADGPGRDPGDVSHPACSRPCAAIGFDQGTVPGGSRLMEVGNTLFFRTPDEGILAAIRDAPARGIDRLLVTPSAPLSGSRRPVAIGDGSERPRRPLRSRASRAPRATASPTPPRLAAPIGALEELPMLVGAGADELYTGLVPPEWSARFTHAVWSNRRSPGGGNLTRWEDLEVLVRDAHARSMPVGLALNAPHHEGRRLEAMVELAERATEIGVDAFIVTDPGLLAALRSRGVSTELRVSSVAAAHNRSAISFYAELGVRRIILPRHVTLSEVATMVAAFPRLDFEAFVMNDQCPFEEGFCFTQHEIGGLETLCQARPAGRPVALELGGEIAPETRARWESRWSDYRRWLDACTGHPGRQSPTGAHLGTCGLCALPGLASAGVHAVKVVGREADAFRKLRSVQMVRRVLDRIGEGARPEDVHALAREIRGTPAECEIGVSCYYPSARTLTTWRIRRASVHDERSPGIAMTRVIGAHPRADEDQRTRE